MTFPEASFHVIATFRRMTCEHYSFSCDQPKTFIRDMEYCTLPSCDDQAEIIHLKDEKNVSKLKGLQFFFGPTSMKHEYHIRDNFIIAELTHSYN